jgi:hypothetical protein
MFLYSYKDGQRIKFDHYDIVYPDTWEIRNDTFFFNKDKVNLIKLNKDSLIFSYNNEETNVLVRSQKQSRPSSLTRPRKSLQINTLILR